MNEKIYKFLKNFSENLKLERKAHCMTQRQVADALGIKTQSYQAYEVGVAMPTVENLLKLSILFELSLDELFGIK